MGAVEEDALCLSGLESPQFAPQLTTVQKKRTLGENLYTEDVELEESISKDADTGQVAHPSLGLRTSRSPASARE